MNLHGIVRGAITAVNPDIPATLLRSTGYSTDDAGKQIPQYQRYSGKIQVQDLNAKEIEHMNFLNVQGDIALVYLFGEMSGVVRADKQGGDIIKFAKRGRPLRDWRVVQVKESWPGWCAVYVCLQVGTL